MDVAGRSKNFLVDTGATYSDLTSYSGDFSSQTFTILGATGKTIRKIHLCTSLLQMKMQQFGMANIFPQVSGGPECPAPLSERDLSLPSKSCSDCSPDRGCFKTIFWGKTNYFYQLPSETIPKWERPFVDIWSKDPLISSSADGKSRPDYIPFRGS